MKAIVSLCAALWFSAPAFAGGYSGWAVPTIIEHSNGGILVYGNFNDVNNCGSGLYTPVFVAEDPNNPDFLPTVASLLMMAVQSHSQVQFYLHDCTTVSWRQGPNPVFNKAWTSGVIFNSPSQPVGVSALDLVTRLEALEAAAAEGEPETELVVTPNLSTTTNVWTGVDHDTLISITRSCGANGGQYTYVYLREHASASEQLVEQARCWEYNTDTATFMVPAGWQYKFTNYAPELAVSYAQVPVQTAQN